MRWIVVAMLIGCGGRQHWTGDPDLYNVDLVIEADADPYTALPAYKPYLRAIIERTSLYFGYAPEDVAGLRILVSGHLYGCASRVTGGCYDPASNTAMLTAGFGGSSIPGRIRCTEGAVLPHELLHYFIGDPQHSDARWSRLPELIASLDAESIC